MSTRLQMRARASVVIVAAVLGVLGTVTSCGSASSTPQAMPSTPIATSSTAIAMYLSLFRGMTDVPEFSPQRISDAKLIAVGREVCTALTSHTPAEVLTILEHEGWSRGDGSTIIGYAAGGRTLCAKTKAVQDWETAVLNAGPYPS
ncbi:MULTISPECIES: DUF732 domain-containing protein [Streptacidiphilus]|uniref:DUF732 domain-containing protein n=1 Tax=Streptacidiphilus cavernicola TaxID=3342716 RepID=A0ABV6UTQ5_9ACTN|nr:DUF732 domain-containing protein [Streptacidiphilus jeojiense]